MLKIGSPLALPDDAATQKLALIGRSGSGKSYAAGKIVEELLGPDGHRNQVVIVDPVGVWHGLRLAADGKKPGIAIPIFGGEHGDVPLEATAGALVAGLIVDKGVSLVLDVSGFTGGELRRFVADFATELLHRKKRAKSPLMVVWEEAQEVVPQHVYKDAARMVGAMERLIKIGRNFGIGTLLITQRPQAVAKDVLNQTEVLLVFQTTGPQERKVVEGWIVEHGADVTAAVDELPKLPRGTCYAWSPQWLQFFGKVTIGKKWTFDASATPTGGQAERRAGALAPVDLDAIRSAMSATIEAAKANDPRELRARIAQLERQLAAKPAAVAPTVERVEVPVLSPGDRELLQGIARTIESFEKATASLPAIADRVRAIATVCDQKVAAARPAPPRDVVQRPAPSRTSTGRAAPARPTGDGNLVAGERAILTAIAQHDGGVSREQLSVLTGYKRSSRDTYLQKLRAAGLIDTSADAIRVTDAGLETLGPDFEPLPTGMELLRHWLHRLPEGERRILNIIAAAYPSAVDRERLSDETGYKRSSRDTYLQKLSARRLVESVGRGEVRMSEALA